MAGTAIGSRCATSDSCDPFQLRAATAPPKVLVLLLASDVPTLAGFGGASGLPSSWHAQDCQFFQFMATASAGKLVGR
jgi:hypothetical protein